MVPSAATSAAVSRPVAGPNGGPAVALRAASFTVTSRMDSPKASGTTSTPSFRTASQVTPSGTSKSYMNVPSGRYLRMSLVVLGWSPVMATYTAPSRGSTATPEGTPPAVAVGSTKSPRYVPSTE